MRIFTKDKLLTPSWSLVRPSIKLVKENIWQVIYLSFLPTLVLSVGLMLLGDGKTEVPDSQESAGYTIAALAGLWTLLTYPGFLYMQAQAVQGKQVSAMEAFKKGLPKVLPFVAMSLVAAILIMFGLLVFIIPGLLLIRGFFLASFYLVDQNLGPIAALKKSYADSKPVTAWIWGLIGVQAAIGLVTGSLTYIPVIGMVVGVALGYIYVFAPVLRYAEITKDLKVDTNV